MTYRDAISADDFYYVDGGADDTLPEYEGKTAEVVAYAGANTLPIYTNDQVAGRIQTNSSGGSYRFGVRAGGTLTYTITGLTGAGQALAREALAVWSDVTGIQFSEVASGGQIMMDDNAAGAYTSVRYMGSTLLGATVNISTDWLASYGTGINSYSFQAYLHELGHALGLSHAGPYNGSATYATDAVFRNDSWAATIMSYFPEWQNDYVAGQGLTTQFDITPMVADAIAVQNLYGTHTTLRTGDTTYGFNNTSGRPEYDAANARAAFTIYDDGGTDTLDYSGFSANQVINLNAEASSSVAGQVGNLTIARGVTIENAIGGAGNDTLIGNAVANILSGGAGNDTLDGGAGADTMYGGTGDDSYVVDNAGDLVIEYAGQGYDTVRAGVDYTLAANVEALVLTGATGLRGTGNALDNRITGTSGNDTLATGGGHDVIDGGAGTDVLALTGAQSSYQLLNVGGYLLVRNGQEAVLATNIETIRFTDATVATPTLAGAAATFDGLQYIAANPDLAATLGSSAAAALNHFLNSGFYEGRSTAVATVTPTPAKTPVATSVSTPTDTPVATPTSTPTTPAPTPVATPTATPTLPANFDPWEYMASNPDVALAYGADTAGAARHYLQFGIREGRSIDSFDALRYLASNIDVAKAYGANTLAAEIHYVLHGIGERRLTTSFDPLQYAALNPDLAKAFSNNAAALETHYIRFGIAEGRATSGFDTVAYLLSNTDLAAAHLNLDQAINHWIQFGIREGRAGDSLFGREQTSHAAAVGTILTDALQSRTDHDWFAVSLSAGQHVSIGMHGTGFAPTVAIADENGRQLAAATASGADAAIDFTADHAATYYLTTGSTNGLAGTYQIDIHTI